MPLSAREFGGIDTVGLAEVFSEHHFGIFLFGNILDVKVSQRIKAAVIFDEFSA